MCEASRVGDPCRFIVRSGPTAPEHSGQKDSKKAIIKLIYLAIQNAQTIWNGQIFGWAAIRQDLDIIFNNRLSTADTVD
jgi:hypothetical protein